MSPLGAIVGVHTLTMTKSNPVVAKLMSAYSSLRPQSKSFVCIYTCEFTSTVMYYNIIAFVVNT